jgi:hypothetical protein
MDNSWLKNRNRGIHMTIRDVDCEGFDAKRMARDFHEMGVNFFSFFAGGYITTYPSDLPESRRSPWLGDRDLVREILDAAHTYGIKAAAMADFSVLPIELIQSHPEWAKVDRDDKPYEYAPGSGVYTACILGGYRSDYGVRMIREILSHYGDVDAMKFGGGSYGFDERICYCERCRERFLADSGLSLPDARDWSDPVWRRYHEWKTEIITETVVELRDAVLDCVPDMPVMGNAFSFGGLDMERIAAVQEMVQLESQGRVRFDDEVTGHLDPLTFTTEAASYMTNVTDTPAWLVVSYFTHAPWRRSAFTEAEQRVYMAQIAAFGAMPMVNLSGGPPAVHEDMRGFKAPAEIWRFVRDHEEYYNGDKSGAEVALVYSDRSVAYYGKNDPDTRYKAGFRGVERALWEQHVPFDIISPNLLMDGRASRYKVLVLPGFTCMRESEAEALREFVRQGGGLVADFESSLMDEYGDERPDFLLGELLGVKSAGAAAHVFGDNPANMQNYCKITARPSLLNGLEDTSLLPVAGHYRPVEVLPGAESCLSLGSPFLVLPEGLSYQSEPDIGSPMAVSKEHEGGGRTVYLAGEFGKLCGLTGLPELTALFANSVLWALRNPLPYRLNAPDCVLFSLRTQPGRVNAHLVNLGGGQRFLKENLPVHGLSLEADKSACGEIVRAYSLQTGKELAVTDCGACYRVEIDTLAAYDVIVMEQSK